MQRMQHIGMRWARRGYASMAPVVHSPAVLHLVLKHQLNADVVASIPPTGPKGRLLKGDVLQYLQVPSHIPMGYYGRDFNLTRLQQWANEHSLSIQDAFTLVLLKSLESIPKVDALYVARLTGMGLSAGRIPISFPTRKVMMDRILKPTANIPSSCPFTVRLYDQTQSPLKTLFPFISPTCQTRMIMNMSHIVSETQSQRHDDLDALCNVPSRVVFSSPHYATHNNSLSIPQVVAHWMRLEWTVDQRYIHSDVIHKMGSNMDAYLEHPESLYS